MGLLKFLEKKQEQKNPLKRVFDTKQSQDHDLKERVEYARRQAYEAESIRQAKLKGRREARKPQGSGILGSLGNLGKGALDVMEEIGSMKPAHPEIFGNDLFNFGPSPTRHKKRKKR